MAKMSKDEYNARRREKYAAKRKTLTRDEARSTGKAIQKNPDLVQGLVGLFRGIAQGFDDAAQGVADVLTGGAKQLTGETKKPRKSNYVRKTVESKKTGKRVPTFENFVKKEKEKNPTVSNTQLKKSYRGKGGSISDKKAREIITEVIHEKFPLTRYYGRSKNPLRKKFLGGAKGNRYQYIVRYGLKREGATELETNYITVSSDEKLDEEEIINTLMQSLNDNEGQKRNTRKKEYYTVSGVDVNSIVIEYAIDMEKP